jgi:hypothetical protein
MPTHLKLLDFITLTIVVVVVVVVIIIIIIIIINIVLFRPKFPLNNVPNGYDFDLY